jgi:cytochrome c nitrite reductase small subunit
MTPSRGISLLPIPVALAATFGLAVGIGAYAFHYAKGASYLGNDPATCANCHVMAGHLAGWQAAPHHLVATCNDCHTPAGPDCRRCHAELVEDVAHGAGVSCVRCHASVGHLR